MSNQKMYRLGNQEKQYPLLDSFIGFYPEGFPNWENWDNILGEKKYPCDLLLVRGEEKIKIFFKKIIVKEAFSMDFFVEERAKDWTLFAICSLVESRDEEFIIPLYPYK